MAFALGTSHLTYSYLFILIHEISVVIRGCINFCKYRYFVLQPPIKSKHRLYYVRVPTELLILKVL